MSRKNEDIYNFIRDISYNYNIPEIDLLKLWSNYGVRIKDLPNNDKKTIVYTDGSCIKNPGPGGWAIRIIFSNGDIEEYGGRSESTTNNKMELKAIIEALSKLIKYKPIVIYTDSQYAINGITKWVKRWAKNGWKTATGGQVKNKSKWVKLDYLLTNHYADGSYVTWVHVPSHTGEINNERVDEIAKSYAKNKPVQLIK